MAVLSHKMLVLKKLTSVDKVLSYDAVYKPAQWSLLSILQTLALETKKTATRQESIRLQAWHLFRKFWAATLQALPLSAPGNTHISPLRVSLKPRGPQKHLPHRSTYICF